MIAFISLMVQKVLDEKLDESNRRYLNFNAMTIQKYWRGVVSNPHHVCCQRRLQREFDDKV